MTCDEFRRRWLDGDRATRRAGETATGRHGETARAGDGESESAWGGRGARGDTSLGLPRPMVFGAVSANGAVDDTFWMAHADVCPSCATWVGSQLALDEVLTSALVVAAPPDLAARLAAIPAPAPRARTLVVGSRVLDYLLPVILALGVIGLSGAFGALLLGALFPVVDDALQALPYILSAQLLAYLQNLTSVFLQALATLILVALVLLQIAPATASGSARPSNQA